MNPELRTHKPVKVEGKLVHRIYCSKCLSDNCVHFPALTKPTSCKCGAQIIFARGQSGKPQPLVPKTLESHFADCSLADKFRKKKIAKELYAERFDFKPRCRQNT